jgi:predicted CoA-binding protein
MPHPTDAFLAGSPIAVCGASTNRAKYGNKVLRCLLQHGRTAIPINPRAEQIEGVACYPSLTVYHQQHGPIHGVSFITPPAITRTLVDEALGLDIAHLWMQPGAQHPDATAAAHKAGVHILPGNACLLVVLGYDDGWVPTEH